MTTEADLSKLLHQLTTSPPDSAHTASLLSKAKRTLLHLNALLPTPDTPPTLLAQARSILEEGALLSIRAQNPEAFTRYYQQLQPFYELPSSAFPPSPQASESHFQRSQPRSKNDHTHTHGHKHASAQNHGHSSISGAAEHLQSRRGKITGLYLLLLLTKGDYAAFHTVLEGLESEEKEGLDGDQYVRYPVMLEQWLMEGAYDRVWGATKREGVPSEEFGVFSEVLVHTIRSEIASCSEKAYPSLPVTNAKNLLFLDSEGAVVAFAQERGWVVKDGRIYFPIQQGQDVRTEKDILVASGQVIENTIGYARELETIV